MITAKIDGKIARVGELKPLSNGNSVYNFTIGVWLEKENRTEYVQAACFGELASQLSLLEKNAAISVIGALKLVEYTSRDGVLKQALNVTVNNFIAL